MFTVVVHSLPWCLPPPPSHELEVATNSHTSIISEYSTRVAELEAQLSQEKSVREGLERMEQESGTLLLEVQQKVWSGVGCVPPPTFVPSSWS